MSTKGTRRCRPATGYRFFVRLVVFPYQDTSHLTRHIVRDLPASKRKDADSEGRIQSLEKDSTAREVMPQDFGNRRNLAGV